jgi:hypothetical protein
MNYDFEILETALENKAMCADGILFPHGSRELYTACNLCSK